MTFELTNPSVIDALATAIHCDVPVADGIYTERKSPPSLLVLLTLFINHTEKNWKGGKKIDRDVKVTAT